MVVSEITAADFPSNSRINLKKGESISGIEGLNLRKGVKIVLPNKNEITISEQVNVLSIGASAEGHFVVTNIDGSEHFFDSAYSFSYPQFAYEYELNDGDYLYEKGGTYSVFHKEAPSPFPELLLPLGQEFKVQPFPDCIGKCKEL